LRCVERKIGTEFPGELVVFMLNRVLSMLLTAMIVACPCICKGGAGRGSDRAEFRGHCDCCHLELPGQSSHEESSSSDNDSQPISDHQPNSGDCGHQCICKGAVVEDAAQFDIGLDMSWWIAVEVTQPSFVAASCAQGGPLWATPPPDDGANPGRTMCCRYETFLC
jgi:hypothetical protein